MKRNQRVVVLEAAEGGQRERLALERRRVLTELAAAGGKVRHDSGGRYLVVDLPESAEAELSRRLPQARIAPPEAAGELVAGARDETETLFLEALRIRSSKSYRAAKRRRKVGETPEEKALVSGSCVREDY